MNARCATCGEDIDGSGPAVTNDFGGDFHWAPFVEDIRSNPHQLRHAICFANEHGVGALIDAVHREDLRRR